MLSNALNPASNVFNSTISIEGADARTRSPAYPNQLGFDADVLATTGVLGNGQTSTQVRLTTNGDAYQPGVVTIATELFAPRIEAAKSVDRADANLGDELVYTTTIRNTGQDSATEVDFDDTLPAGVTPLPGTLTVDGAPVPDPSGGALRLADIAPGGQRIVAFKVRVDDSGIATGTVLENVATVAFTARDLGTRDTIATAPARTRVRVPDIAITKRHAPDFVIGVPSAYTIDVNNAGDAPTVGPVTVTDTLDLGLAVGAVTAPGWTCSAPPALVCTRSDALAPGASYPSITIEVTPRLGTDAPDNTATVAATPDGDTTNDSYTDAGVAQLAVVDLVVTKTTVSTPSQVESGFAPASGSSSRSRSRTRDRIRRARPRSPTWRRRRWSSTAPPPACPTAARIPTSRSRGPTSSAASEHWSRASRGNCAWWRTWRPRCPPTRRTRPR